MEDCIPAPGGERVGVGCGDAILPGGGAGHLAARLTYPGISDADNMESIRLYATDVVPALREIASSRATPFHQVAGWLRPSG